MTATPLVRGQLQLEARAVFVFSIGIAFCSPCTCLAGPDDGGKRQNARITMSDSDPEPEVEAGVINRDLEHEPVGNELNSFELVPGKELWRNVPSCGLNATYIFLRLHGVIEDYHLLEKRLPVTNNGSSLKDMRDAVRETGIAATVVRASPQLLPEIQLPAIAHLDRESSEDYSFSNRGHYVVIVSLDRYHVRVIDGTSGAVGSIPLARFSRLWSGYLLITDSSVYGSPWLISACCLAFGAGGWSLFWVSSRLNRMRIAMPNHS